MSNRAQIAILFDGYIREIEKSLSDDQIIPKGINAICFQYYQFGVRLNVYHEENAKHVLEDGKVLKLLNRSQMPFGCDEGYNKGVHEWTVKLIYTKSSYDDSGSIGITTDVNVCRKKEAWIQGGSDADYSFMKYYEGLVRKATKHNYKRIGDTKRFGTGDTVTVILDCDKWRFKIKINDKVIDDHEIEKNYTYYFVINARNHAHFEIID